MSASIFFSLSIQTITLMTNFLSCKILFLGNLPLFELKHRSLFWSTAWTFRKHRNLPVEPWPPSYCCGYQQVPSLHEETKEINHRGSPVLPGSGRLWSWLPLTSGGAGGWAWVHRCVSVIRDCASGQGSPAFWTELVLGKSPQIPWESVLAHFKWRPSFPSLVPCCLGLGPSFWMRANIVYGWELLLRTLLPGTAIPPERRELKDIFRVFATQNASIAFF